MFRVLYPDNRMWIAIAKAGLVFWGLYKAHHALFPGLQTVFGADLDVVLLLLCLGLASWLNLKFKGL
ncbi:MAG: hypothetical protein HUU17_06900 [Chthonomonadales bacterium]|nr:hypothetical protein [Chthonomonadales bacterium]